MDTKTQLRDRLAVEFEDAPLANDVVQRVGSDTVAAISAMCGTEISTSPRLSYRPATLPSHRVDAVVAFSYGYRLADADSARGHDIPPMDALLPGPVNELLAEQIAVLLMQHPLPVIAQWEIAQALADLGARNVISIEPDVGDDGSTVYLSTAGVLDKGLRLAAAAGIEPHCVGVFGHVDHAPRCVATARWRDLDAGVITGIHLPAKYDPHSGQRWTRDRATWIATDLFARTKLIASTDWNQPE